MKVHQIEESGYYWYRYKDGPCIVVLHRGAGVFQIVGDEILLACNLPGEFDGPLRPPRGTLVDNVALGQ